MNKLDPRVDQKGTKDIDSNSAGEDTTTGKPHHKGPVVLGGPAVGATTHEAAADKHGLGTSHDSNLHTGTDSGPLGSGHHGTTSTSHTGRDAALGVGAAGAAEHEHNKSKHDSSSLTEKPVGTDTGDKLHGVERNRGVQGHSSTVGDSGHHIGGSQNSSHVGHGHTTGAGEHSSHTGRDAAVLGGAAYEGQKHEPSTHHIGGETSSHVGHGHSGHHDRAGLTDRSAQSGLGHQGTNQDGFAGNSQTGTGLTGSNDSTNLSRDNTTEHSGEHKGFDSEARRGTTSGLHTNPAIHHVPAVGKHHQN
ncbi:hypothetical protein BJ878DRAFT_498782 [Calycina marina]|uniref:Uncharacterized protein n=1 Tax=Calycina marina TaxID=1763456 RepID=A0A9P7Z6V9_9HELO|nr:hypothetical protein BJ878DRAFT_498782 [Calycina marina]